MYSQPLTNIEIEYMLTNIRLTAAGCNGIQACFCTAVPLNLLIL